MLAVADGSTIGEIGTIAMMQQSALSRMLATMEDEKDVSREPRRADERYLEVYLGVKGRKLFNSLDLSVRSLQNKLLKGFSREESDAAFAMISRLCRNMQP